LRRTISAAILAAAIFAATAGPALAQAPVADFSVSPNPVIRYGTTTFRSAGSCAATPCTYRWTGADGVDFSTSATTTYVFRGTPGPRSVTLRVTDRYSRSSSRTKSFQLVEPSPTPTSTPTPTPTRTPTPTPTSTPTPTPTSTPTPTPTPGGYPNAGNTGVPAGTTLTPSGRITVTKAGTVISGLDVSAQGQSPVIAIAAPNVTIRNTRVRGNAMALIQNDSTGLVVEDSELINAPVAGQANCHNGIGTGNYTVRRLEITGCENGAETFKGNVVIESAWIHDLDLIGPSWVFGNAQPHTDGIQLNGASNVVIRNNTIDPLPPGKTGGTSAIIGFNGGDNVRIEGNLIDGGGSSYAIYAPRTAKSAWFIDSNLMGRGLYGYTACVKLGNTVTSFAGNLDATTKAALTPDNGVGGGCTN
jgi:hypothetical protein